MRKRVATRFVLQDVGIIITSVVLAVYLAKTDVLISILTQSQQLEAWGSFIAGIFFTSVFTTAPAIATLGELAQIHSLFWTALLGALGAVMGDLIIFRFIKDRFSEHLMTLLSAKRSRNIRGLFCRRYFRWFTFLIGGLIIASPLPDELGIGLLGLSRMKLALFIPISFMFNFLGIVLVGFVSRTLI